MECTLYSDLRQELVLVCNPNKTKFQPLFRDELRFILGHARELSEAMHFAYDKGKYVLV